MDVEREVVGLLERTSKIETDVDNLGRQFTAVEKLATSVQEIALTLGQVVKDNEYMTKRVQCIEDDQRERRSAWWKAIVGVIVGAVGAIVVNALIK